jgi:hypothetical protein
MRAWDAKLDRWFGLAGAGALIAAWGYAIYRLALM